MKFDKFKIQPIVVLLMFIFFSSCNKKAKELSYNSNRDKLLQMISAEVKPNEVLWSLEKIGESDSELFCILSYTPNSFMEVEELIVNQKPLGGHNNYVKDGFLKEWFSESVKNLIVKEGNL